MALQLVLNRDDAVKSFVKIWFRSDANKGSHHISDGPKTTFSKLWLCRLRPMLAVRPNLSGSKLRD